MSCFAFKLRFQTPVHFGGTDSAQSLSTGEDHFRADTLFSALCHTALQLWGETGLSELLEQTRRGGLTLSDSMPWQGEQLYLPKPCFPARERREIPAAERKRMKKLAWIPVSAFSDFSASLQGGAPFDVNRDALHLGSFTQQTKVAITGLEEPMPYQVSTFSFAPGRGLWFLARCGTAAQAAALRELVAALGLGGIGGKTSAGYGRFTAECLPLEGSGDAQLVWLRQALERDSAPHYLLLTSSLPAEEELAATLEGAWYQIVRRGGFVQSDRFAPEQRKKQTQFYLAAGAVTSRPFSGALYSVAEQGGHPVYRYSIPMLLGVTL